MLKIRRSPYTWEGRFYIETGPRLSAGRVSTKFVCHDQHITITGRLRKSQDYNRGNYPFLCDALYQLVMNYRGMLNVGLLWESGSTVPAFKAYLLGNRSVNIETIHELRICHVSWCLATQWQSCARSEADTGCPGLGDLGIAPCRTLGKLVRGPWASPEQGSPIVHILWYQLMSH